MHTMPATAIFVRVDGLPDMNPRIVSSLAEIGAPAWDELVTLQGDDANPFLSFAFLDALHASGSASTRTGWEPHYLTLWRPEAEMKTHFHSLVLAHLFSAIFFTRLSLTPS